MSISNLNNPESEDFLIQEDSLTISDRSESSSKKYLPVTENYRYFAYIGNFGGLAGLNTAVYVFYNRYHNRYYVGQTINLQARLNAHFQALDKGIHKNKEFQKDYDNLKNKGLDHQKEIYGSVIYQKFEERIYTKDEIYDITRSLIEMENAEISRLVLQGEKVYNLDEYIGIPCFIKGKFYTSLESARQGLGLNISINQVKFNLSNPEYPDWYFARDKDRVNIIPSTDSTRNRPVHFTNPITKKIIVFESISACSRYLTDNFNAEQKKEFRKLKITISRKRIQGTCSLRECKFMRFATLEELENYKSQNK